MQNIPLTVSQLTQSIKLQLESRFQEILLQGEISNFKKQPTSGHLYFSIKDAQAQIAAVMFRSQALSLNPLPKAGDQVIVKGAITVYPPQGGYQILVKELYYVGLGALLLKFEQLKKKLEERGWFSPRLKKPLPQFPKRIGVVTSPSGAVIQDILHILTRRFSGFHLILNPVKVQGEGAAEEIAQAIEQFNEHKLVDVIIVGRGGGSLEDLWAFNEERVAEAIFHSQIPIISAVGHETDYCLADFVADVRAPTPSSAAEIVTLEKAALLQFLSQSKRQLLSLTERTIKQSIQRLNAVKRHPLFLSSTALLGPHMQHLDRTCQSLQHAQQLFLSEKKLQFTTLQHRIHRFNPSAVIPQKIHLVQQIEKNLLLAFKQKQKNSEEKLLQLRLRLNMFLNATFELAYRSFDSIHFFRQIDDALRQALSIKERELHHLRQTLSSIDPRHLLKKGYAILLAEKGNSHIISIQDLRPGQRILAKLSDGTATLSVEETQAFNP